MLHARGRQACSARHVARQGIQNQSWWPSPAAQKESQMEKRSFDAVPRRIQADEMCVFLSHRRVSNSARLVNIRGSRRGPRLPLIAWRHAGKSFLRAVCGIERLLGDIRTEPSPQQLFPVLALYVDRETRTLRANMLNQLSPMNIKDYFHLYYVLYMRAPGTWLHKD